MPSLKRKRVLLNEPPQALVEGDPNREVFYLAQTGEIFDNYEMYSARMSFYRSKQFQCEVTGKSNLDYFQAIASEQSEGRAMQSRFPDPLKRHVLRVVQWRVMGRLDHLVEAVYERFKDRFFVDEKVFVDIQGDRFLARIAEVYPPRNASVSNGVHGKPGPSKTLEDNAHLHIIGTSLDTDIGEAKAKDNPADYYYKIQLLDEEKDRPDNHHISKERLAAKETVKQKWSDSLMEVQAGVMSRDRLAFSKSILRRFIRDSVDREAAVASPWVVKRSLAEQYGLDLEMPTAKRIDVENLKKTEADKRRKVTDDSASSKKSRKTTPVQQGGEAESLAPEKKKKPIRYPTEDLNIRLSDRDLKAGMKIKRPPFSRVNVPFNEWDGAFEGFIMSWNFLMVFSQPLHLSSFSLDEFEYALRHAHADQPCQLLAEVHATLIYNLRTVTTNRHCAVVSLLELNKRDVVNLAPEEPSIDQLNEALADVGNNWERVPLRHIENREGWEEALVGCLKDNATITNFPDLRGVLARLLFAPEPISEDSSSTDSSSLSTPSPSPLTRLSTPMERYYALSPADRVKILSFMCELAVSSKAIRQYMETSDEQLTALRKDKIEVNRTRKAHLESIAALSLEDKPSEATAENLQELTIPESSDLSEPPSDTEGASESGSNPGSRSTSSRQVTLRIKTQQTQAHAKERELARAKAAEAKQALADKRRLEEEVGKLDRRLEVIEREFRKLLGVARVKPLGRDRFYNRVWWFDGFGGASLVGSGGVVQYGTGRLFLQGPSQFDKEILDRRVDNDLQVRRVEEEGREGILASNDWAVYSDVVEVEEFVAWLNPKGNREVALKNTIIKWWPHMGPGMRKRLADVNAVAKLPEARRSSRVKASGTDVSREPYMSWQNRRAVNANTSVAS